MSVVHPCVAVDGGRDSPAVRPVALVLVVAALLVAAGPARAGSLVSVRMTGAGTVTLAGPGGLAATCPAQAPLANPDTGASTIDACAVDWAPTCTPGGSGTCRLQATATARVPGPPQLTSAELGGWALLPWTAGPCAGARGAACAVPLGSCTAQGCTYQDAALGVAFDDTRAPVAAVADQPPAVLISSDGVATFRLRSNEYGSQETASFECQLDGGQFQPCPGRPAAFQAVVGDGAHSLRVRATDPSGNQQKTGIALVRWTQRFPPVTTIDDGPADGEPTNHRTATLEFHADRPSSHRCRIDGRPFHPCTSPFTTPVLAEGAHVVAIRATRTDVPQNVVETAPVERAWTVDTTAPRTVIDFGPADGAVTTDREVTFTFAAGAGDEDATFVCRLDGALPEPCDTEEDLADLTFGQHTFAVVATDAAGNREPTAQTRTWTVVPGDADGDGVLSDTDCDDTDPTVFPGATDIPDDFTDQNCDGEDAFSADQDADGVPGSPGPDCDDFDPTAFPGATEVPEDGVDQDCDGDDAFLPPAGVRLQATWRVSPRSTRLVALDARNVPAGTTIRIACKGPGCPAKAVRVRVTVKRRALSLERFVTRRVLRPGAVLDVRATKDNRSPQGTAWTIRAKRRPVATPYCVLAGERQNGACV